MQKQVPYKRVLLKLSGETLVGSQGFGIQQSALENLAQALKTIKEEGLQLGIVIGGGNLFRGIQLKNATIARTPADQIGMLATLMNGLLLEQALSAINCPARVLTALECPRVAESYTWHKATDYLNQGNIVIFSGGTGNPYFTTDTAAALRASEIQADVLAKATKVDGVYSKDPLKHKDAVKYDSITYSQILTDKLGIMDATAIAMCRESSTPIFVFNMNLLGKEKIGSLLKEEKKGTWISDQ
jgi:uridylate kinase